MKSIWQNETPFSKRETLTQDIRTEVAIIGAGMTGILLADRLKAAGKDVVILEANTVAGGQTAGTTAKITAQHGIFYHDFIGNFGEKKAFLYAKSQQEAIAAYEAVVRERKIDCDWQKCRSFLYSVREKYRLEQEAEAARHLGFSAAFTTETDLPISVKGAVCFENQAMFQPLKFLKALADDLKIYEHTPVLTVEDTRLHTPQATVTATYIVFACHFPFVNFPGLYFTRMHQERSLVLALSGVKHPPQDLYYGIDKDGYSLRPYRDLLLFGGEGYRTGTNSGGKYALLEKAAKKWFPDAKVTAAWSAQDCMPAKGFAYIGRYSQKHLNWFVATGYRKWGMTASMTAAMLLCDILCNRESPLEDLYTPDEFSVHEVPQILKDTCLSAGSIASHILPRVSRSEKSLKAGKGAVVGICRGGYRDTKLRLHTVSLRCPHLGCRLHFNPDEKTWECPCHGSRFDGRGRLIDGPAQKDITKE